MHHRVRLHRPLLSRLHVLERGSLVAEDRNVPGTGTVSLLELALQRTACEFESCRMPGAPHVGGKAERRGGVRGPRVGDVEIERRWSGRLRARTHEHALDA